MPPKWTFAGDRVSDADLVRVCTDFSDILALADPAAPGFRSVFRDAARGIEMFTKPVTESPIHLMRAVCEMPCEAGAFLRYLEHDLRPSWDDHFLHGRVVRRLGPLTVLKYLAFRSPMPFVQARDFELVVSQKELPDGRALVKALSPPMGTALGLDPRFVRGNILLSGFVAAPLPSAGSASAPSLVVGQSSDEPSRCRVTYVALINPMGLVPAMLVNVVIGKQTTTMAGMQRFVREHPFDALPPYLDESDSECGDAATDTDAGDKRQRGAAARSKL